MKTNSTRVFLLGLTVAILPSVASSQGLRQSVFQDEIQETQTVDAAVQVLDEIMAIPGKSIPQGLIRDAEGLVIVPKLLKGGFVVGIRHGRGVLVTKDEAGNWTAPSFVTVTGGSLGWQAGVQATDIVLVFATRKSLEGLWQGKFTIGAGVAAAAGPVGREAAAATDATLRAEIYTYSRSRGLFAGVALDGSAIQIDRDAGARYYSAYASDANMSPGQPQPLPPSALRLLDTIARYTGGKETISAEDKPGAVLPVQPTEASSLRQELVESSLRLHGILDRDWQMFLALPAETYESNAVPAAASLRSCLARFDKVASDPQYQSLAKRPEFQETHSLLKRFIADASPTARLALPPPPE